MNIPGFTTKTLLEFNAKVKECLRKDDDNSSAEKDYGVRSFPDWREFSNKIEEELKRRDVQFDSIQW